MLARKRKLVRECPICGKTFKTVKANKKFCSSECYNTSVRETSKERGRYMSRIREYFLPVFKSSKCLVCGRISDDSGSAFCSQDCYRRFEDSISISLEKLIPEMDGLSCSELTEFAIFGYSVASALHIRDKVKKGFRDEC